MEQQPKKSNKGIYIALGCVLLPIICCACSVISLCVTATFFPQVLLNQVMSDKPLDIEVTKWSKEKITKLEEKMASDIAEDGETTLTGEELSQYMMSKDANVEIFRMTIDKDDRATVDASIKDPQMEKYFNFHYKGTFEVKNEKFTNLEADELVLGSIDLGQYLKGEDLSKNSSSSSERNNLNGIKYLGIKDGKVKMELDLTAFENMDANL